MFSFAFKLAPIAVIFYTIQGSDLPDQFRGVLDTVGNVRVMSEMKSMKSLLQGAYTLDEKWPSNPIAYVKENLTRKGGGDVTLDPWGTQFAIERARKGNGLVIVSAGPDKRFRTKDDVMMTVEGG